MEDIFLARQPIYNRQLNVVGYELLYRDNEQDSANFSDGSRASSQLIINTFIGLGLENIVGSSPAYINLSEDFFLQQQPIPMTSEQIVLELLGNHLPTPQVMRNLADLVARGYRIALDDFVYTPELEPLIRLAHVIKLDLEKLGPEQFTTQVEICRRYPLKLLAKKVESAADMDFCSALGMDYFQGYFFCKPQLMRGRSDPANRSVILQLLNELQKPNIEIRELENTIVQDVALTYKLLRYLNCATYALRREIDSVYDALMLIGTHAVKKWATLLLLNSQSEDKPRELITVAMIRARMCELLAERHQLGKPEMAFTVGLFSTLDALMDTPIEELLDTISLNSEIKFAILAQEGRLGGILKQVLSYECGDWSKLDTQQAGNNDLTSAYLNAVSWAAENSRAMSAA
ncbi:MAG: EAL and HDOD domain-containing protein [Thiohalomonadaceae bacterium]